MTHDYTSTACQHEAHGNCRESCKFCAAPCKCTCHQPEDRLLRVENKGRQIVYLSKANTATTFTTYPVAPGEAVFLDEDFKCVWKGKA